MAVPNKEMKKVPPKTLLYHYAPDKHSDKNSKAEEKPYKINREKYFRLNYRIHGKLKTLAVGIYPDTTLKKARGKSDIARNQIANGIDPIAEKKADCHDFKGIALRWFESKKHAIEEQTHKKKLRHFEIHVFPVIGHLTITKVPP